MNEKNPSDILERYSKVAIIGAGVIGASWTAVFLAHGLTVVVNDPRDDVEAVVNDYIRKATPTLKALGLPTQDLTRKLRFEADLDRAVSDVDLVQENGPERVEFKQDLWARIEQHVPAHALLLSSSSAKTATEQSLKMKNPSRLFDRPSVQSAASNSAGGNRSRRANRTRRCCGRRRFLHSGWQSSARASQGNPGICRQPAAARDFSRVLPSGAGGCGHGGRTRRYRDQLDRPALGRGRAVPFVSSWRRTRGLRLVFQAIRTWNGSSVEESGRGDAGCEITANHYRSGASVICSYST